MSLWVAITRFSQPIALTVLYFLIIHATYTTFCIMHSEIFSVDQQKLGIKRITVAQGLNGIIYLSTPLATKGQLQTFTEAELSYNKVFLLHSVTLAWVGGWEWGCQVHG